MSTVMVIAGTLSQAHGEETLIDYFMKKSKTMYVIAETPKEVILKVPATGEILFFGTAKDQEAMVDYCKDINGKAVLSSVENEVFEPIYNDRHVNATCISDNGKGFVAKFYQPEYSWSMIYDHAWLDIKFDSPQPTGNFMKYLIKRKGLDQFNNLEDFGGKRANFTRLEDGIGYCTNKGGKYLMSTDETLGYALDVSSYYIAMANKLGNFKNEYSFGRHWCVDTTHKEDEFSVTVSQDNIGRYFKVKPGADRSEIKLFDGPLPPYFEKVSDSQNREKNTLQRSINNDVSMSKQPGQNDNDLAKKVFSAKNNVLARQNGAVMEGIYLGQNDQGCHLAALTKSVDRPYGHQYLYGNKNMPERIMGFKQCRDETIEYIGESFETNFPVSIESEYNRVLNSCKIRGMAMGSYLGYNIDCQRQGPTNEPLYEIMIVKKDKLVTRVIEK
ncbi:MAG: hypothetical protein M0P91_07405 [Sulfuricurvum sp.]|jgi:hypothetical protein|uniref:hypothetical protein n=1 Tax=Sulfuricurvum sp. TaxID=2025608 RepID=UPI0025EAA854|nr:hypothetical protein [Sulfuricurvum sp.]MCK9373008.1 hypothetical protein [Sulfuricurvum sp.]